MTHLGIKFVSASLIGLCLPLAASAQTLGQAEPVSVPVIRLLLGLLICLGLVVILVFAMKRSGGANTLRSALFSSAKDPNQINIISVRKITQDTAICAFHYDATEYLVMTSGQGLLLLNEKPAEPQE